MFSASDEAQKELAEKENRNVLLLLHKNPTQVNSCALFIQNLIKAQLTDFEPVTVPAT